MKVAVLYHQYGNKYQSESVKYILKILKKISDDYIIVITDSLYVEDKVFLDNKVEKVSCSNSNREFSGWQKSFDHINKFEYDIIIFCNDTIIKNRKLGKSFLRKFIEGVKFINGSNTPCILGDLDEIRACPPYFDNEIFNYYISTYFFAINRRGIQIIKKISYHDEIKSILNDKKNLKSVLNPKYSSNAYYNFIEKWLYLESDDYKWYKHEKLSLDNYQSMHDKFRCIINENYLSQLFSRNGGELIDYKNFCNNIYQSIIKVIKK